MIKSFKLFVNYNEKSIELAGIVRDKFIKNGFVYCDVNFDLGISIGGDGSFLRMIKDTKFDEKPYYVGINAGTLGFVQEVKPNEVDNLIHEIKNDQNQVDVIGIQETTISHDGVFEKYYSLNEIIIRDDDLKLLKVEVSIDGDLLENYTGDGLLIATSTGSTAHNLSYGGSIVFNNFSSLQITPIAPINSKSFKTLPNSLIIPDHKEIKILPNTSDNSFVITIDGINKRVNHVDKVTTFIGDRKIKMLRFSHYNFPQKINEKLLSK